MLRVERLVVSRIRASTVIFTLNEDYVKLETQSTPFGTSGHHEGASRVARVEFIKRQPIKRGCERVQD